MAERRMFAKTIIDSDAFIDMPLSTQALYFHLSMRADDEGFINNPKKIQRMIGGSDDDLKLLIAKRFILPFDSGVVVIKHWKIHNYIQKDRFKETLYKEERSQLTVKKNGSYTEAENPMDTECIQDVSKMETQVSIGKDSLDKVSLVEGSVADGDTATAADGDIVPTDGYDQLSRIDGPLGQGVVYLSTRQIDSLVEKLGIDAFDRYVRRLSDFILEKKAHINNHYETILKWYEEDSRCEFKYS